jgi:hypothetical protein
VKQGDPASPDLFGLYIETFCDFVDALDSHGAHGLPLTCPHTGHTWQPCRDDTPQLDIGGGSPPLRLPAALFADDVNLIALSSDRMNYLLTALSIFCGAFGMSVNVTKCELLVFHPVRQMRARFATHDDHAILCGGRRMQATDRARYLGLYYGPPDGRGKKNDSLFVDCHKELLQSATRAAAKLQGKLAAHGMYIPGLVMAFHRTCVQSVMSFGAQVWGTAFLTADFDVAAGHELVKAQFNFMRRVVGAHTPSSRLLCVELGELPLQHHWAGLVFRFWNKLVGAQDSLGHAALRSDIRLGLERGCGWAHDVISFLHKLQYPGLELPPDHRGQRLGAGQVAALVDAYGQLLLPDEGLQCHIAERLLDALADEGLDGADPRVYAGPAGTHDCKYVCWMGLPDLASHPKGRPAQQAHAMRAMGRDRHMCLMRFRLCQWSLAANRSYEGQLLPSERVCLPCVAAQRGTPVEDELHVLMECPEHQALREEFTDRLPFDAGMLEVMTCPNQADLGEFLCRLHDSFVLQHDRCVDAMACEICLSQGDPAKMLICQGTCGRAWHRQCCMPPVTGPMPARRVWRCGDCTVQHEAALALRMQGLQQRGRTGGRRV